MITGRRPAIPGFVPGIYQQLITSCWDQEPRNRPTFRQIIDKLFTIGDDDPVMSQVEGETLRKYQAEMLNALDNRTSD
jgi:hypothetical protein